MEISKCKICRRAGEKLFLKGERCFTPKCAIVRKPYPPGVHTQRSRRGLSEYGTQLREKQKLRNLYHLRENQFRNYVRHAMSMRERDSGDALLELLAFRLDNIVFLAGFAQSRSFARQLISHGHARVNGKRVTISSRHARVGDVISLSGRIWQSARMHDIEQFLSKYKPPAWIALDAVQKTATITSMPDTKDKVAYNTKLIIEYYAR